MPPQTDSNRSDASDTLGLGSLDQSASPPTERGQANPSRWAQRITSRLSVSAKISCGYAIALGIAVFGTVAGFTIGEHYQRQAIEWTEHADGEIRLLHRLQAGILQARTHQQQLIPLLNDPSAFQDEYNHLLKHSQEIQKSLVEMETFQAQWSLPSDLNTSEINTLIQKYRNVPGDYFLQLEKLRQAIAPAKLQPQQLEAARKQLLTFTNGETALKFDGFSDELVDVIDTAYEEHHEAEIAGQQAEAVRAYMITGSMVVSIAIAVLLAIYISRTIVRPLKTATTVAQRVTHHSDFDLQAPVITEDEVGILTTALNQLIRQVKYLLEEQKAETARQLLQNEKMSSLGRMVAGVAHEINNPINFIYGNLEHVDHYLDDIFSLLATYQTEVEHPSEAVQAKIEDIDLEFLEEDLPRVVQSMRVGSDRVRQIVLSLKNFSRLDQGEVHPVDLHACLDSVLLILNSRIKKGIEITRNYGDIPKIEGYAGGLYQVFMNVLSNAIDALEDPANPSSSKQITITTERSQDGQVVIRLSDTGAGIPSEHQDKVFDTFFTTKPIGVGTGLGLAISRQIVEEQHHGSLTYTSESGVGTEFTIALPIHQQQPNSKLTAALVES